VAKLKIPQHWFDLGRSLAQLPRVLGVIEAALARQHAVLRKLTPGDMRTLHFVDQLRGEGSHQIAKALGVTHPAASTSIERLAKLGLVKHHAADGTDRRRKVVVLTPKGAAAARAVAAFYADVAKVFGTPFGPNEQRAFASLFSRAVAGAIEMTSAEGALREAMKG
jgi:DNA-binding MarR family transcriptional regulator